MRDPLVRQMAVNFEPECLYNVATWRSARFASTGSEKIRGGRMQRGGSSRRISTDADCRSQSESETYNRTPSFGLNGLEAVKIGAGCGHGERELVMTC
jgi:hypothetical protein